MKKVINGALYNTDTARQIGHAEPSGPDTRNFQYFCETLYQTKSGKYFLHGEGHGNSRYGVWHGNTGGWGEKIMPMTPEEAREWAEENLDADIYSEEFGEPEEAADGREVFATSISSETKRRLERLKSETGKPFGQLIDEAFAIDDDIL